MTWSSRPKIGVVGGGSEARPVVRNWPLVAQRGVMRRRKMSIQPIWMDRLGCDQADHDNYDRRCERAARQDPERDSVNIRPHATGRDGSVDGHDGKHAQPKSQKSGHACLLVPNIHPAGVPGNTSGCSRTQELPDSRTIYGCAVLSPMSDGDRRLINRFNTQNSREWSILPDARSGVSFFPSLVNLDRVGIEVVFHRHRALLPWLADLVVKVHKREILTIVFVIG